MRQGKNPVLETELQSPAFDLTAPTGTGCIILHRRRILRPRLRRALLGRGPENTDASLARGRAPQHLVSPEHGSVFLRRRLEGLHGRSGGARGAFQRISQRQTNCARSPHSAHAAARFLLIGARACGRLRSRPSYVFCVLDYSV